MIISNWRGAEDIAAAWVRRFGWADAEVTPPGRDDGIDVWGEGAVAQVKWWKHKKAGIEEVQRLAGSARPGQACLFFSAQGYTGPALLWTYHPDHRVALFQLLPDGCLAACNWHAWRIVRETPFRLPYVVRLPIMRIGRRILVSCGLLLAPVTLLSLWMDVFAVAHGALRTSLGTSWVLCLTLTNVGFVGTLWYTLGPEAYRLRLANRRYRATGSWAAWREAFRLEPERDAGTPPDLFVGYPLRWAARFEYLREDLARWWRFTRRSALSRFRISH